MTTIGITGHQRIPDEALEHVTQGIKNALARQAEPVTGYSSLAAGSDQLFARLVLEGGGKLVAVIPCQGYEGTFSESDLAAYQDLLKRSSAVVVLDYSEPSEPAFMAAGQEIMKASDLVVAVWDGQPAAGLGGTADAVWDAWERGKPVINVWPRGVAR